jgi:hypothetical protein
MITKLETDMLALIEITSNVKFLTSKIKNPVKL